MTESTQMTAGNGLTHNQHDERKGALFGGIIMIGIGLLVFVANLTDWGTFGLMILPMMGLVFLTWGVLSREAGPIIPGGILSGIGLGTLLIAGPFGTTLSGDNGGVFMLSFAAGWFLIVALTALFTEETHWWAAIPGTIMLLVGLGLEAGGVFFEILRLIGYLWPLGLIAVGVYMVYTRMRSTT